MVVKNILVSLIAILWRLSLTVWLDDPLIFSLMNTGETLKWKSKMIADACGSTCFKPVNKSEMIKKPITKIKI